MNYNFLCEKISVLGFKCDEFSRFLIHIVQCTADAEAGMSFVVIVVTKS